jgi:hypothetical protein
MRDINYQLLVSAARLLKPLLDELAFTGGCVTGLLITDEAAPANRPTMDVDAIAEITSYVEYVRFSERLRGIGFSEDTSEGAPVCRWKNARITLDAMPLDEKALGFSNRWYKGAVLAADRVMLEPSLQIRIVTAPCFVATKLEAYKRRGSGEYFGSHDLEDFISVVDGRPSLADELRVASEDLHAYVAAEVSALLEEPRFIDALPGHLLPDAASQARIGLVLRRLRDISRR